jgi:D-alanyl-lipoteichoic acid acyltransferase DltB (MBOAT superfamily)
MLFNSPEFLIFFTVTTGFYFVVPHRFRWAVLLTASYVFYMSWQYRYVFVLLLSTVATYYAALRMQRAGENYQRRMFLWLSFTVNFGLLFFFKYFNFFNESFRSLFEWLHMAYMIPHLDVLLPVGISFFTFQAVAYTLDVYHHKIEAESHLGHFSLYLAFFPKLLAGPKHDIDLKRMLSGVRLFFWGLFKKVVIADRLAVYVDLVFGNAQDYWGRTLLLATYFFTLQIYCDFSAYTDMARGCGRILGLELMENFRFPCFARSISGFWRRWHISLTSWFRDYLYIPLGGNRVSPRRWRVNILLVFLLSALWHGANWTFVMWGALHGFFYLIGKATKSFRESVVEAFGIKGVLLIVLQTVVTFHLTALAWIFFRANSLSDAYYIVAHLFQGISSPLYWGPSQFSTVLTAFLTMLFILAEAVYYYHPEEARSFRIKRIPFPVKGFAYCIILLTISLCGVSQNDFIYFHF